MGSHRSLAAKVLKCDILLSEFEFKSRYYVNFWENTDVKGMISFIPPAIV